METLRVATLNIWNCMGPWQERLAAIGQSLSALAPDIIGLQEVLMTADGSEGPNQLREILAASGLTYFSAYGAGKNDPITLGNAILSRYPIVFQESIALPDEGTDERRVLVFAQIQAPTGIVPFFSTHLNWKLDEGHVRQAQVLAATRHVLARARTSDHPAIIVGDFNAEPDSDEIRYLRGYTSLGQSRRVHFHDAWAASTQAVGPGFTWNNRNPFAALTCEPNRRIDYIFVRGPDERLRGQVLSCQVAFDEPTEGTFPSDHFGLVAEVTV